MKFRLNDTVMIITGNDRGRTGTITKLFPKSNKVLVEGINKKFRHIKGREGKPGEKVEFSAPIDISNVAVVDPKTNKPTRLGYRLEAGEKVRISRQSGTILPKKTAVSKTAKKALKKTDKK